MTVSSTATCRSVDPALLVWRRLPAASEPGAQPGAQPGNRGSAIDCPPSSLQLCIYCESSITLSQYPPPQPRPPPPSPKVMEDSQKMHKCRDDGGLSIVDPLLLTSCSCCLPPQPRPPPPQRGRRQGAAVSPPPHRPPAQRPPAHRPPPGRAGLLAPSSSSPLPP